MLCFVLINSVLLNRLGVVDTIMGHVNTQKGSNMKTFYLESTRHSAHLGHKQTSLGDRQRGRHDTFRTQSDQFGRPTEGQTRHI